MGTLQGRATTNRKRVKIMAKGFVWGVADGGLISTFSDMSKPTLERLLPRMGFSSGAKIVRVLEVKAKRT